MNEDDRTGQSTPSDQESDEKEEGAAIVDTTLEEEDGVWITTCTSAQNMLLDYCSQQSLNAV